MLQLSESKKRLDDQQETMDGYDDVKKKMQRDVDALQQRVDALTDENDRMNKSKKKMQTEVHTRDPIWYYILMFLSSVFAHYHAASISMSVYTSELTLPSGISSLKSSTDASSGPNTRAQINHMVTKSPTVVLTWAYFTQLTAYTAVNNLCIFSREYWTTVLILY